MYFSYVFSEIKRPFLRVLCKSRVLFVTYWPPSYLPYASSLLLKLPSVAIEIDKMHLKDKILLLFVQTYQMRKEVPYMEMSRENDRQRKESPYNEVSRDTDE